MENALRESGTAFLLIALACSAVAASPVQSAIRTDAVTQWTDLAIDPRAGGYRWHSVVLMHAAMHDALNAIRPRYARWTPASPTEPPAAGALPEAAVAAAAHVVLVAERPDQRGGIDAMLSFALRSIPEGPGRSAGLALGRATAVATLARRAADDATPLYEFPAGTAPGVWRPTPPRFRSSTTARYQPFAFGTDEPAPLHDPPVPGSAAYRDGVEEVRAIGARRSARRTSEETRAALFWDDQNSQRNFHALAVRLLAARPEPHDLWESARTMALLSFGLTDSLILAWAAKERFSIWRPITAIHEGGFGVAADPTWQPLVATPPHPDFPSGHATDCSTGAHVLRQLLPVPESPIRYVATDGDGAPAREFPSFTAIAAECAASRLWAGVHFRTANDAGFALGAAIATRVTATMLRPAGQP